jgi:peroxiredoxin
MSIKTGDKIPAATLKIMGEKGPQDITSEEIFAGKKVVLFAVPGAFTPGCSITHLSWMLGVNLKTPKNC